VQFTYTPPPKYGNFVHRLISGLNSSKYGTTLFVLISKVPIEKNSKLSLEIKSTESHRLQNNRFFYLLTIESSKACAFIHYRARLYVLKPRRFLSGRDRGPTAVKHTECVAEGWKWITDHQIGICDWRITKQSHRSEGKLFFLEVTGHIYGYYQIYPENAEPIRYAAIVKRKVLIFVSQPIQLKFSNLNTWSNFSRTIF